ncbi:MAG: putative glycosyl transferase [Firmicutes bacterium ADurb.Bin182]|nr:MAG: putative glycosyl transferase [Firmicutes bacterium ADurb.Bin182]
MADNKEIWMFNHYAVNMFYYRIGRHHSLGKHLVENGYRVTIFCASSWHKGGENVITDESLYKTDSADGVNYVFIKARDYVGNGKKRILNILDYYRNLMKIARNLESPDVIIGSSVHPLACVAAIKLARKYHCKSIAEIRDLWPASLVAYGVLKEKSLPCSLLYKLEKWIYKKADRIIMTWEGGAQYIQDKNWSYVIPMEKIYHISNGVELKEYSERAVADLQDADINDSERFLAIYAGSVSMVNNIQVLIDAAEILQKRGNERIRILIYGKGNQLDTLTDEVKAKGLTNIKFKGFVPRDSVPAVLSHAGCTLLHNTSTVLNKYGQSQNKFFEYLAAGKPILMTYSVGYSVCKRNKCGIELSEQSPEAIADALESFCNMSKEEYGEYCANAVKTAEDYDYKKLTDKLIQVINSLFYEDKEVLNEKI